MTGLQSEKSEARTQGCTALKKDAGTIAYDIQAKLNSSADAFETETDCYDIPISTRLTIYGCDIIEREIKSAFVSSNAELAKLKRERDEAVENADCHFERAQRAISLGIEQRKAAEAKLPAMPTRTEGVGVSHLEWKRNNYGWEAKSIIGTYWVGNDDGWWASLSDGPTEWEWEPNENPRSFRDEFAAQKACQDHYTSMVRSALYLIPTLSQNACADGVGRFDLTVYLERQWAWSKETFGPALRTRGIVQHIGKELCEIEAKPHDLSEWCDVIILAMDGFWRHGGSPAELAGQLQSKQDKNFARQWPDWRTLSEDQAIEHDRKEDTPAPDTEPVSFSEDSFADQIEADKPDGGEHD